MADDGGDDVAAAAEAAVSLEQIAEYESQLAGIEGLLEESPADESLLELKRDMEELLALSRAASVAAGASGGGGANTHAAADDDGEHEDDHDDDDEEDEGDAALSVRERFVNALWAAPVAAEAAAEAAAQAGVARGALAFPDEKAEGDNAPDGGGKKKPGGVRKEKIRDFVLPPHLVPNEADTEAERNKKRRAAKALKNKWRLKKKEAESANRQKSWQSFQKKTGKRDASAAGGGAGSIFATKEGVADRVGVVSTKQLTEFDARKRHKHS